MSKASINFKAAKSNSTSHNEREKNLDYVYSDLSKNNEIWKDDEIKNRQQEIAGICKKLSGRKMQKNSTPIREAVVNLNANHAIPDLKNLAKKLEKEKGIKCFQIFIHRDEGKDRENLNYHAHLVFDWQNKKTGKMIRLNKLDMSEIQTLVAAELNMERGELKVNSNRERLEPIELKRQEREKEVAQLEKKKTEVSKSIEELDNKTRKLQENTKELKSNLKDYLPTFIEQVILILFTRRKSQEKRLYSLKQSIETSTRNIMNQKKIIETAKKLLPNIMSLKEKFRKLNPSYTKYQNNNAKLKTLRIAQSMKINQNKRRNKGFKM